MRVPVLSAGASLLIFLSVSREEGKYARKGGLDILLPSAWRKK